MRISATHSTVYRHDSPVYLEPHIVQLRPRMNSAQRLLAFDLQITPTPAGTTECLDRDGNLALKAWFNAPMRELSVMSQFTAELLWENPFDYLLIGESLNLPLWYREPLCLALTAYRQDAHVTESVKRYAKSVAAGAQWNALQFLTALKQIYQTFRQTVRLDGPAWPSEQTLTRMEGSCRDLAVLFCDVCRVMGIAARFSVDTNGPRRTGRIRTCTPGPTSIYRSSAGGGTILLAVSQCPTHTSLWPLVSIPTSPVQWPVGTRADRSREWKLACTCM
jgi:transglutaminase-like putative cysteine protease